MAPFNQLQFTGPVVGGGGGGGSGGGFQTRFPEGRGGFPISFPEGQGGGGGPFSGNPATGGGAGTFADDGRGGGTWTAPPNSTGIGAQGIHAGQTMPGIQPYEQPPMDGGQGMRNDYANHFLASGGGGGGPSFTQFNPATNLGAGRGGMSGQNPFLVTGRGGMFEKPGGIGYNQPNQQTMQQYGVSPTSYQQPAMTGTTYPMQQSQSNFQQQLSAPRSQGASLYNRLNRKPAPNY